MKCTEKSFFLGIYFYPHNSFREFVKLRRYLINRVDYYSILNYNRKSIDNELCYVRRRR